MRLWKGQQLSNYMFKVNNRNTRKRCGICSKLTMQWIRSGVFIVNFKHNSHLALLFLMLTLTSWKVSGFIVRVEAPTNSKRVEGSEMFYEKWCLAKRGDPIKKVVPDFFGYVESNAPTPQSWHQCWNIVVLATAECLQYKDFSCRQTMVPNSSSKYSIVSSFLNGFCWHSCVCWCC